jgi:hypothetical protein
MKFSGTLLLVVAATALFTSSLFSPVTADFDFNILDPSSWVDYFSSTATDIEANTIINDKPDFCGKSECPPFTVEDTFDDYEVRKYEKGHWAVTHIKGKSFEKAYVMGTTRLTKYFKGGNTNSTYMDMTVPTLICMNVETEEDDDDKMSSSSSNKKRDEEEEHYALSMWLPSNWQDNPPRPTAEEIELKEYEETTSFVRVFGGFATENKIKEETANLRGALDQNDEDYEEKEVFVAVYDPAVKLLNRHNELHIVEKGSGKEVGSVTVS